MKTVDDYHHNVDPNYNRERSYSHSFKPADQPEEWEVEIQEHGSLCRIKRNGELVRTASRLQINVEAGQPIRMTLEFDEPPLKVNLKAILKQYMEDPS